MSATKSVDPELNEALEDLICDNVESSRSFQEAARSKDGSPMAALLREIALARFAFAADLRRYVRPSREQPQHRNRPELALQAWWSALASSGEVDNARALLAAAERAELEIEADYERVLARLEDHPVLEILREQEHEVRRHHGRIHDMRARSISAVRI